MLVTPRVAKQFCVGSRSQFMSGWYHYFSCIAVVVTFVGVGPFGLVFVFVHLLCETHVWLSVPVPLAFDEVGVVGVLDMLHIGCVAFQLAGVSARCCFCFVVTSADSDFIGPASLSLSLSCVWFPILLILFVRGTSYFSSIRRAKPAMSTY